MGENCVVLQTVTVHTLIGISCGIFFAINLHVFPDTIHSDLSSSPDPWRINSCALDPRLSFHDNPTAIVVRFFGDPLQGNITTVHPAEISTKYG